MIVTRKSSSTLDGLAAEIIKTSEASRSLSSAAGGFNSELRSFEQHDYARPLRRSLSRCEVRSIVAEARKTVWPHLNDEFVRLVSPSEFTRFWSGLGVQFRLAKLSGAEGLALLGFYVRKMGGSRLPLICVNTAHHPAAVGAAFSHEMGHHLTGQLFDSRREHAQLLTYTPCAEHLDDPEELAADVLVSLGVFPKSVARKIFTNARQRGAVKSAAEKLPDTVFATVLKYCEGRYGLGFGGPARSGNMLQYLAGLIHFAKLRCALLTEYDL